MKLLRIYFKKFLLENDFRYFSRLVLNEEVMIMNYGRVFSLEEAKNVYDWFSEKNKKHIHLGSFKVFQRDSNYFIGFASILPNDDLTEVEIEYMLLPEHWRKGYGTEIVMGLLNKAEKVNSIQKVSANTNPNNIGSKKILLNNGFSSVELYKNYDDNSSVEMFIKEIMCKEGMFCKDPNL